MSKILVPTPENIEKVAQALKNGEVIGFPTETVYGLAGNAKDPNALTRIFEAKKRPKFDPLIVHIHSSFNTLEKLEAAALVLLGQLTDGQKIILKKLISAFWPGPLTLILPKHPSVPDLATSGLNTVAIRMPSHPVSQELLRVCQLPLAAPSANRFGRISPTSARAVEEELGTQIPWILDGGFSTVGLESTVLGLDSLGNLCIFRPGGIPKEEIEKVLGIPVPSIKTHPPEIKGHFSPGMLSSHYAPGKPFKLLPTPVLELPKDLTPIEIETLRLTSAGAPVGLLVFKDQNQESLFSERIGRRVVGCSLSQSGDLGEAARNLFSHMRKLDMSEAAVIFSEPCLNQEGLGFAISDRLKRASTENKHI